MYIHLALEVWFFKFFNTVYLLIQSDLWCYARLPVCENLPGLPLTHTGERGFGSNSNLKLKLEKKGHWLINNAHRRKRRHPLASKLSVPTGICLPPIITTYLHTKLKVHFVGAFQDDH